MRFWLTHVKLGNDDMDYATHITEDNEEFDPDKYVAECCDKDSRFKALYELPLSDYLVLQKYGVVTRYGIGLGNLRVPHVIRDMINSEQDFMFRDGLGAVKDEE